MNSVRFTFHKTGRCSFCIHSVYLLSDNLTGKQYCHACFIDSDIEISYIPQEWKSYTNNLGKRYISDPTKNVSIGTNNSDLLYDYLKCYNKNLVSTGIKVELFVDYLNSKLKLAQPSQVNTTCINMRYYLTEEDLALSPKDFATKYLDYTFHSSRENISCGKICGYCKAPSLFIVFFDEFSKMLPIPEEILLRQIQYTSLIDKRQIDYLEVPIIIPKDTSFLYKHAKILDY